ncbi:MAG: hypothetical protein ACXVCX_03765, partial [Ktedonobacterales bacterium]
MTIPTYPTDLSDAEWLRLPTACSVPDQAPSRGVGGAITAAERDGVTDRAHDRTSSRGRQGGEDRVGG